MTLVKILALTLFLFSCQHLGVKSFAEKMSAAQGFTHIQSQCRLIDFNGKEVYRFNGSLCLFSPDGSTVVAGFDHKLAKYDKQLKLVWSRDIEVHHQIKAAEFDGTYLVLKSRYSKEVEGESRHDQLAVLDADGNIIKSFEFKNYLDGLNVKSDPWPVTTDDNAKMWEYSHLNSIAETYKIENGKRIHTGYVANDKFSKLMFFFDKSLSKMVKIVDMGIRLCHDVSPISDHEYIFYTNQKTKEHFPRKLDYSLIEMYDSSEDKFKSVYENRAYNLISHACSSVQYVSPTELFILHSNCPSKANPPDKKAVAEFVDLKSGISKLIEFKPDAGGYTDGRLINAASYLRNINFYEE